ncbi:hypothetical protein BCT19_01270 [Vibrio splendidus]|uniref:hypothetical protein n=1 Tax=Vibrio splendidus TaxID=29497 RepID=UPI000C85C8F4|nr:hypothetical protein [Vibrio splendidus]PMO04342.1 hypothetical protein BCT19_01270 [Vibrio splendidus]
MPTNLPSLEHFDVLNTLSLITKPDDYVMPEELELAIENLIDVAFEYRLNSAPTHYINQLLKSNNKTTELSVSVSSLTGVKGHVINTKIRQALIAKMNQIAHEHERKGDSLDKKLYVE